MSTLHVRPAERTEGPVVHALTAEYARAFLGGSGAPAAAIAGAIEAADVDALVAVDGDRLVAYAPLRPDGGFDVATVDADAGRVLLGAVEERARARGFAELETIPVTDDQAALDRLDAAGFIREREVLRMHAHVDGGETPTPPPGLRAFRDGDARPLYDLLVLAYGDSGDALTLPFDAWRSWIVADTFFDPELVFLVEDEDGLAAAAINSAPFEDSRWVKDLVVHPRARRRGLGAALLRQAFAAYARRGIHRVGLKVDADNPTHAYRLYERVGFAVDKRYVHLRKRL